MTMYFSMTCSGSLCRLHAELQSQLVALVGQACKSSLRHESHGEMAVDDCGQSRTNAEPEIPGCGKKDASRPVDYDVPSCRCAGSTDARGRCLRYACHATVLPFFEWSGTIRDSHSSSSKIASGAVARSSQAAAEIRTAPRRSVELARNMAFAVPFGRGGLASVMTAIEGQLDTRYSEIALALDQLPSATSSSGSLNRRLRPINTPRNVPPAAETNRHRATLEPDLSVSDPALARRPALQW